MGRSEHLAEQRPVRLRRRSLWWITALSAIITVAVALLGYAKAVDAHAEVHPPSRTPEATRVAAAAIPMFAGTVPTVPGLYRGLTPGMTAKRAHAIDPRMPHTVVRTDPGHGVRASVQWDRKRARIQGLWMVLDDRDASKRATAAWGAPLRATGPTGKTHEYWFAPTRGLRVSMRAAAISGMRVDFERYLPLRSLLGPGTTLGFETARPLLDQTMDQVAETYGDALIRRTPGYAYVTLPPTELGTDATQVELRIEDERVTGYRFRLPTRRSTDVVRRYEDALRHKFGEPEIRTERGRTTRTYRRQAPRVAVSHTARGAVWTVDVRR